MRFKEDRPASTDAETGLLAASLPSNDPKVMDDRKQEFCERCSALGSARRSSADCADFRRWQTSNLRNLRNLRIVFASSQKLLVSMVSEFKARASAKALADEICSELADWEETTTRDAVMAARRGRSWLPDVAGC
jgi:hypothetical protein